MGVNKESHYTVFLRFLAAYFDKLLSILVMLSLLGGLFSVLFLPVIFSQIGKVLEQNNHPSPSNVSPSETKPEVKNAEKKLDEVCEEMEFIVWPSGFYSEKYQRIVAFMPEGHTVVDKTSYVSFPVVKGCKNGEAVRINIVELFNSGEQREVKFSGNLPWVSESDPRIQHIRERIKSSSAGAWKIWRELQKKDYLPSFMRIIQVNDPNYGLAMLPEELRAYVYPMDPKFFFWEMSRESLFHKDENFPKHFYRDTALPSFQVPSHLVLERMEKVQFDLTKVNDSNSPGAFVIAHLGYPVFEVVRDKVLSSSKMISVVGAFIRMYFSREWFFQVNSKKHVENVSAYYCAFATSPFQDMLKFEVQRNGESMISRWGAERAFAYRRWLQAGDEGVRALLNETTEVLKIFGLQEVKSCKDGLYDTDGDGVSNTSDNCPEVANPKQENMDRFSSNLEWDGLGDFCDDDMDGDGVKNTKDNCVIVPNGQQEDADGDGVGDMCAETIGVDYSGDKEEGESVRTSLPISDETADEIIRKKRL
jgi:hypothetical protein